MKSGAKNSSEVNDDHSERHILESKELKKIMHSLDHVDFHQELNSLQIDDERRRRFIRFSEELIEMSKRIVQFADNGGSALLDGEQKKAFVVLAQRLNSQGKEIGLLAEAYRMEALGFAKNRIEQTCNECHTRFRK